jgi:hypothetical protein
MMQPATSSLRVPLWAEVQCSGSEEVYILSVRDATSGGLFLEGDPSSCPSLRPGAEAVLDLSPENAPEEEPVRAYGRVVRVVWPESGKDGGFAIAMVVAQAHFRRLFALIGR